MLTFTTLWAAIAACNLHLCLYGALAMLSLAGASAALAERRTGEVREKAAHGLIYALLGLI